MILESDIEQRLVHGIEKLGGGCRVLRGGQQERQYP